MATQSHGSPTMLRGALFDLPSGQEIARRIVQDGLMCVTEVIPTPAAVGLAESPLWFYILHEADVLHEGEHLGPVGGRIVGEVILHLIPQNPVSLLNHASHNELVVDLRQHGRFTMVDLLRCVSDCCL